MIVASGLAGSQTVHLLVLQTIVNRGKWLGRPVNIKEANKLAEIYVRRSLNLCMFCFRLIDYA